MIWADTNILIRLITKDPQPQFEAVVAFLQNTQTPLRVHPAHICEAIFVLEGQFYQYTSFDAAHELSIALSGVFFQVIDYAAIAKALAVYPSSNFS